MKVFRNESGFALPLALLVMVTTSAILVTAIKTTSSTGRTANIAKTKVSAEALAEAGLANGVSILAKPGQNTNQQALMPSTEAAALNYTMENGTAKLWGVYDTVLNKWTLYSKGVLPNPTGSATPVTKTLSRTAQVLGIAAGATVPEWSRFLYDDASTCFTIDTVTIPGAVASRGPMCLRNGGNVAVNSTGAATTVGVGGNLTVEAPNVVSPARTAPTPTATYITATGWTNALFNVLATSDTNRATYSIPCCNALSNNLDARGMFFTPAGNNIPTTAIIRGIQVDIIRNASATSSLRDEDVVLLKAGAASGSDYADTGTDWGTADFNATYGGPTDLWGTTWTPAQINANNFGVRLRIKNRHSSSARTASINQIRVTVTYTGAVTTPAIGASGSPILKADIVGTCKLNNNATAACDSNRGVWATTVTNTLTPPLVKPQIDLDWWWANAKPGPKHPCTEPGNTFPNTFDNDAASTTVPNNSVQNVTDGEITPMNASYTCQVKENGVLVGEISWNNATHVLKVQGTIYIDGDIRFDDNGQIVHYQGRAIIYSSDDVEFDERVCAGGTGLTNCAATPATMAAWNPATDLLTILAGDKDTSQPCCPTLENAEFDHSTQGSNSSQGDDPAAPGAFQGIVYAKGNCQIHEFFKLSGPVICNRITIDEGQEPGVYPTLNAFPPLGSLVDGSVYLNPDLAQGGYGMTLGPQTG